MPAWLSDLVVVAEEDVGRREHQLKHGLLVALLHLETQPFEEARGPFGTIAATVLHKHKRAAHFLLGSVSQ